MKKLLIIGVIVLGLCVSGISVNADPVVNDVSVVPAEPTVDSELSFTAWITGLEEDDVVSLYIKECDDKILNVCNAPFSVLMTKIDDENFTATATLEFDTATYLDYWFEIESNGETIDIMDDGYTIRYTEDSSNGSPNGGGNDDDGDETPGFEIITLFAAIVIGAIIFLKRKR